MQLSFPTYQRPSVAPLDLPNADVEFVRDFLSRDAATDLYERLVAEVEWKQDTIRMFGKTHLVPRLHQWFGDPGALYRWSGIEMIPEPWTPLLREIRRRVEQVTSGTFNSVLLNYYRNGDDTVGWHSDDEPALGNAPTIASLSLGSERDFVLRNTRDTSVPKVTLPLTHGSLLVMSGSTQRFWEHAVPRRKGITDGRVNLTFRSIYPA